MSHPALTQLRALRYFKERKIPVQYIDLTQRPMSKGEYRSVKTAVGGWQAMVNEKAKGYEDCYLPYLAYEEDVDEKILENQGILKTPIVRNGKQATIEVAPEVWKTWK